MMRQMKIVAIVMNVMLHFFWETTSEYVGYDDHADDDALHKNLKNNLYSQLNI